VPVREAWGYGVWGAIGVVIAVPEVWAAVAGGAADFPTISGTVGYLEYWHPWVAVLVVGVLVWAAFHAVRYEARRVAADPPPVASTDLQRTKGGRWTMRDRIRTVNAVAYFTVAFAAVIGLTIWSVVDRPGDRYRLGEVLYGSILLFGIVGPSLIAFFAGRDVPFPTLFATMQMLERRVRALAVVITAGIVVLLVHLAFYPWPAVIPDLQDLHAQRVGHDERKQNEPPVDVP
jgi:hypothetical protein